MTGEVIESLNLQVYLELSLPDGARIVNVWPVKQGEWDLHTANHNVFRLNANNEVVWQVRREESEYVNWESRNQHAKEKDPNSEGYMDPFTGMSTGFFERQPTGLTGPFQPTVQMVYFDDWTPGRLVRLNTRWWGYDLDPVTGIATCTGEQVK